MPRKMKQCSETLLPLILILGMFVLTLNRLIENQIYLQNVNTKNINKKHTEGKEDEGNEHAEIFFDKEQKEGDSIIPRLEETSTDTYVTQESTVINGKNDKLVVIHVGPHKTGSTNLQQYIFNNEVVKIALEGDNYKVPIIHYGEFGAVENDPKNHAVLANCFLKKKENTFCPPDIRDKVLDEFKSFIDAAAKSGSNILMTSEAFDFDTLDITEFMSYFLPHQYKLHVVVYYRRFYDWARSTYAQRCKKPAILGQAFPTFPQWLDNKKKNMEVKYSRFVYDRFKTNPNVFNVSVVNLHQNATSWSNIPGTFFCDHLDGAPLACEAAKLQQELHDNFSEPLDKEWLRGEIRKNHPITLTPEDKRWEAIENEFQEADDLPRICLNDVQQKKLLDFSLECEKAITPESWHNSPEGLEGLKADFESQVQSELCSIDFPTMVASPKWQKFLKELEN